MFATSTVISRVIGDARKEFYCSIFGEPRNFLKNKVLTYGCVLRCSTVASMLTKQIKYSYDKASIHFLSYCLFVNLINVYHDSYINMRKSYKCDIDNPLFKARLEDFKLKALTPLLVNV